MKGIILAGGKATRLRPASLAVSKQLMPVYDKPLIYYPLTTLILSGINDILLISTPQYLPQFKELLSNSNMWGIKVTFAEQKNPGGIAESLIIGQDFISNDSVCLILGDNLFHGIGLGRELHNAFDGKGALISAYQVSDPRAYGVVEISDDDKVISLEEKPTKPKSNWAIPGIYFYDSTASDRAKKLKRSPRGELEITDLNKDYLAEGNLKVSKFPRGTAWLDVGTPNGLLEASEYIRVIQERQGLLIGSPEEAAWRVKFIDNSQLRKLGIEYSNTHYGEFLVKLSGGSNEF